MDLLYDYLPIKLHYVISDKENELLILKYVYSGAKNEVQVNQK